MTGFVQGSIASLVMHALNQAFARIPYGFHTLTATLAGSVICILISVTLRFFISTIVPFEALFVGIFGLVLAELLYSFLKCIPVRDEITKQVKLYAVGTWLHMPASHRFDLKARAAVRRVIKTT